MNSENSKKNEILPVDFEKKIKLKFKKQKKPEVDFLQFLEGEKAELFRLLALEKKPSLRYKPTIGTITPCGNGDFEKELDINEWQGAYGSVPITTSNPISNFTSGIVGGSITSAASHQTQVSTGIDQNVGIPTTAQNSSGSVRIGNAINGFGSELLSKSFVVTPSVSTITFWYAVVMQNPIGHPLSHQPLFWVRVTDVSGNIVIGAFDFGNGSDKLIADNTNPFFQEKKSGGETIVYKDWSCAQIDLSKQIGKQVTIEFITGDCGYGGHWGYAYIDNFCGDCKGSPTGNITYNCEASSLCGSGNVCLDYSLPSTEVNGNTTTGDVTISLDIYQNGILLTTLTSPKLTTGNSYCFNIVPSTISGIDSNLGGFDFVATGTFAIGTTALGSIKEGIVPYGIKSGQNNDYQIECKSCIDIQQEQNAYLNKLCSDKVNLLQRANCGCPDIPHTNNDCNCKCEEIELPDIQPCISIKWGDSQCDSFDTNDFEVLCITVCNCFSNVTFNNLSIGQIQITDMEGNPVPQLPDGTPSVQVVPSGSICFGDIGPCKDKNKPSCVSRELVLYTRGAVSKSYQLSFSGVCFNVSHNFQSEQCFVVNLCQD